jgi:hypothetical protein
MLTKISVWLFAFAITALAIADTAYAALGRADF